MPNPVSVRGAVVLLAASVFALAATARAEAGQLRADVVAALRGGMPYVANELVVQFRPGVTGQRKAFALQRSRASLKEVLRRGSGRTLRGAARGDLVVAGLPAGLGVSQALGALALDPDVAYAEPNWIYRHQGTADDPYYTGGKQWGMSGATTLPANAYGSGAAAAWAKGQTDCSSVYVGLIDEGYMHTHPDLAANAGTNPGEIAGNFIDDDANGYIDDVHGWDFNAENNTVFDGVMDDHGTHVAGIIGAVGGNATGVAGMCWSIKLLSAKFLTRTGGTLANAVRAIDYFTDLKLQHGINIVATNNSWTGGAYSQALEQAIERANAANILFIAAAGNRRGDNDRRPTYPASYTNANVIAVAAITQTGARASFSNYGATSVDLGAPGTRIYSTVPRRQGRAVVPGYASYSGTSMAAPHVTGAAALYAATHPGSSAAEIKEKILMYAAETPTPSLLGKTLTQGRLNVSGF